MLLLLFQIFDGFLLNSFQCVFSAEKNAQKYFMTFIARIISEYKIKVLRMHIILFCITNSIDQSGRIIASRSECNPLSNFTDEVFVG